MIITLVKSHEFEDDVKRYSRKYRHIEDDLNRFYQDFQSNPKQEAVAIPGYERKIWKVRVQSSDLQRGKSGGFRLIFYFDELKPETVHLLTIYPKTEREDLSRDELLRFFKSYVKSIIKLGK